MEGKEGIFGADGIAENILLDTETDGVGAFFSSGRSSFACEGRRVAAVDVPGFNSGASAEAGVDPLGGASKSKSSLDSEFSP